MGKTSIEWTDASWNPIVGCTEISPGCANCYAARLAATRLKNTPQYKGLAIRQNGSGAAQASGDPRWTGEVRFLPERLEEPLHWRKPCRIFVCDMGDLFHENVSDESIYKVFAMMWECSHHTFQILTKRADRMQAMLKHGLPGVGANHLWLGVSVENQHFADERIPLLLATPAAVRWISAEPLLGPVEITSYGRDGRQFLGCYPAGTMDSATQPLPGIDWVVCGGESGPNARPMHPDWARSLRDQCQAGGVPFFFKQWGEWLPETEPPAFAGLPENRFTRVGKKKAGRLLDGRTWDEFPTKEGH